MGKKVLITGASGFIGRATILALSDKGWTITQSSRVVNENDSEDYEIVYLDLSDPTTVINLAKGDSFDVIVHLGALVGWVDKTDEDFFVPNVLSTGCLVYLAKLWGARLVFASTATVHGCKTEVIKADSIVSLDTAYAKSKWHAEQLLVTSNVKHCILRIAGVFGCGGPEHLALNRAIDRAIKGEPPLLIGTGEALRNYIYVKDVAQAIVYALQENIEGVHLLAGHEVISVRQMLQRICDTFLPSVGPTIKDGSNASNQVITPSVAMPKTRGFQEALFDIQKGYIR